MSDDAPIRWTAEDYALAMGELPALNAAHAEIARLRARVGALESAMREAIDAHRSRMDPDDDNWCRRCGAHWIHEEHGHGCPVGRALAVLREATVASERGSHG